MKIQMARAKYLRSWLLLPVLLGGLSLLARVVIGPEPLPDPAGSILVYLMLGALLGGIPYGLLVALIWQPVSSWRPWTARVVTILLPWVWCAAGFVLLAIGHSEHQAASSRFPWGVVVAFAIWTVALVGLERVLVRDEAQLADR